MRDELDYLVNFILHQGGDTPSHLIGGRPRKPVVGSQISLKFNINAPAQDYAVTRVEVKKKQPVGHKGELNVYVRRLTRLENDTDSEIRPALAIRRNGKLLPVEQPEVIRAFEFKGVIYETHEEARAAYIGDAERELVTTPLRELVEKAWAARPTGLDRSPEKLLESLTATISTLILDPRCGAGERLVWGLALLHDRRQKETAS